MSKIVELVVKYDDGQEKSVTGDALLPWAEWLNYQLNGIEFPDVPNIREIKDSQTFLDTVEAYTGEFRKLGL